MSPGHCFETQFQEASMSKSIALIQTNGVPAAALHLAIVLLFVLGL